MKIIDPVVNRKKIKKIKKEEKKEKKKKKRREKDFQLRKNLFETNRWNKGLISVARRARPTRIRTIPSPKTKSSTEDLMISSF